MSTGLILKKCCCNIGTDCAGCTETPPEFIDVVLSGSAAPCSGCVSDSSSYLGSQSANNISASYSTSFRLVQDLARSNAFQCVWTATIGTWSCDYYTNLNCSGSPDGEYSGDVTAQLIKSTGVGGWRLLIFGSVHETFMLEVFRGTNASASNCRVIPVTTSSLSSCDLSELYWNGNWRPKLESPSYTTATFSI